MLTTPPQTDCPLSPCSLQVPEGRRALAGTCNNVNVSVPTGGSTTHGHTLRAGGVAAAGTNTGGAALATRAPATGVPAAGGVASAV